MTTIDRALGLLEHFSDHTPELGLSELVERSGFDKATVHRYIKALKNCGIVEQNMVTRGYRLGPALVRLSHLREATVPLSNLARDHVDALARATGELVHASVAQPNGMSNLHFRDGGSGGTRVGFDGSSLLPYHATSSGLAMLAFGEPSRTTHLDRKKPVRFTPATSLTREEIAAKVAQTAAQGFAFANETYEAEVCSLAVPVFDGTSHAVATVSIATPKSRMDRTARARFIDLLIDTSRKFSTDLGGSVPTALERTWHRIAADTNTRHTRERDHA